MQNLQDTEFEKEKIESEELKSEELETEDFDPNDSMMITDEAIAVMAGVAAAEVDGVARMSGGFTGGIVEALGRKNLSKGVKVVTKNDITVVDLYVVVKYGYRMPDLAFEIQENVKSTIESLSGISVDAVNIHIQGVDYSEETEIVKESESEQG